MVIKINKGEYIIALSNIHPFYKNWSDEIIPKGSVGIVLSVTSERYKRYAKVKWVTRDIGEIDIRIDINEKIKIISKREYQDRILELRL